MKETEARTRETEERRKEFEERMRKESERESEERRQESEERRKESEERRKESEETARELKDVVDGLKKSRDTVNALTGKWGVFVEGLVLPATERLFKERGIEVDQISQHVKSRKSGFEMEIDILAVNGDYVVAIEVKSTLSVDDVKKHLKRLGNFKSAFRQYADRQIIGAVAGIVIEEGVDTFAYHNGLFVIGQRGDSVKILNDDKFVPKSF
ncbi:MAG: DUF3782 domain-containing protein [Nitrospirae bacterium]|nr:DUF3782 domain-containing protein [Nitrospirota bacterium]MBF0590596.1 DUF3782 domain-containing protein [Nitrospirota bacterium]